MNERAATTAAAMSGLGTVDVGGEEEAEGEEEEGAHEKLSKKEKEKLKKARAKERQKVAAAAEAAEVAAGGAGGGGGGDGGGEDRGGGGGGAKEAAAVAPPPAPKAAPGGKAAALLAKAKQGDADKRNEKVGECPTLIPTQFPFLVFIPPRYCVYMTHPQRKHDIILSHQCMMPVQVCHTLKCMYRYTPNTDLTFVCILFAVHDACPGLSFSHCCPARH